MRSLLRSLAVAVGITGSVAVAQESPTQTKNIVAWVWAATAHALDAAGTGLRARWRDLGMMSMNGWLNTGWSQQLNIPLVHATIKGTDLRTSVEYSKVYWAMVNAGMTLWVWDNGALSLDVRVSKDLQEILAQWWWKIGEWALFKISFQDIRELKDFIFPSGEISTRVDQKALWGTLRIKGNDFLRFLALSGHHIWTSSQPLWDVQYVINTPEAFQIFNDPRRIAWGTSSGFEWTIRLALSPDQNAPTIDVTYGHTSTVWDTLVPTPPISGQVYGTKIDLPLGDTTPSLAYRQDNWNKRYELWVQNGWWGVQAYHSTSRQWGPSDRGIRLSYSWSWSGTAWGWSRVWGNTPSGLGSLPSNVRDFVTTRPAAFPYSVVLAKADPTVTPKLLVQIDKKGLPPEMVFDNDGNLVTTLPENPGTLLSAINTSNEKDLWFAFRVQRNTVIFHTKALLSKLDENLTSSINTIEVITSNDYKITIIVIKDSVHVTWAKLEKLKNDAPDTFTFDKSKITINPTSIFIPATAGVLMDADNWSKFNSEQKYIVRDAAWKEVDSSALTPNTPYTLYVTYKTGVWNKSSNTLTVVQRPAKELMKFRTTEAPDTIAPTITLAGSPTITLAYGATWIDPGATCVDNTDATCTVVTTGIVNTTTAGTYIVTYTATDKAGNASTKMRTVIVALAPDTIAPVLDRANSNIAMGSINSGEPLTGVLQFNEPLKWGTYNLIVAGATSGITYTFLSGIQVTNWSTQAVINAGSITDNIVGWGGQNLIFSFSIPDWAGNVQLQTISSWYN